jgi:hypothetical protein
MLNRNEGSTFRGVSCDIDSEEHHATCCPYSLVQCASVSLHLSDLSFSDDKTDHSVLSQQAKLVFEKQQLFAFNFSIPASMKSSPI